ncbi:unnamed protein product [Bursaphelenchus xylophilus]|uniref:(pine wood nematode) hypothetical protein n=1 Tax=Bursaphelenchus xylophilus TaxID=6326 RepID=A0A811K3J7_BURXY|nr:unnamed protein product [Bursaphelenchus xylophilus]CAG9085538.1 unnamed protein product [Bursaphelenchus xylophilus]
MSGRAKTSDELLQSLFHDIQQTGPVNVDDILIDGTTNNKRKKGKKSKKEREGETSSKKNKKEKETIVEDNIKEKKEKKHKDKEKKEKHKSKENKDGKRKEDKEKKKKDKSLSKEMKEDEKLPEKKVREWDIGKRPVNQNDRRIQKSRSRSPLRIKRGRLSPVYSARGSSIRSPPRKSGRGRDGSRGSISPIRNGRSSPRASTRRSRSPYRHPFRAERYYSRRSGFGFDRISRSRSRSWSPHRFKRRKSSRSPQPRELDEMKVDKKELIAIAEKNAYKLMMAGKLPKNFNISASLREKSIKELIKYCEDISSKKFTLPVNETLIQETDQDFDFTTLPVKAAIKLNVGTAMKPKSALERLIEESALRKAFPVSSGDKYGDEEWEPVPVETTVVTALSSKKVKVAPVYLFSDPPPPAPVPPPPPRGSEVLEPPFPPPPSAPILDWALLQPPPPPPVCAGFDAPAITKEIPAPPQIISDFSELLSEDEKKDILEGRLPQEPEPMDIEEGEIIPPLTRWEPIALNGFVQIKRKKKDKVKKDNEKNGGAKEKEILTKESEADDVKPATSSAKPLDEVGCIVRDLLEELVSKIVKEERSFVCLDQDELEMLTDMLEDSEEIKGADAGNKEKEAEVDQQDASQGDGSSSDSDDSEEGPMPMLERDNEKIIAIGESVFGSFLEIPNFSSDISMLPAVAPVRCGHLVAERARLTQHLSQFPNDFATRMALADIELKPRDDTVVAWRTTKWSSKMDDSPFLLLIIFIPFFSLISGNFYVAECK